jgi:hypothetical protein
MTMIWVRQYPIRQRYYERFFLEKKDPVPVARETDHSPEAVGKYCQQFNKVKWCVENEMGKEEIRIVTGMKTHLIDEEAVPQCIINTDT